ncbi:SPOR domain-containing protein [Porphyrobacter sp. YT40]|uniref:SPOR domain-containing protein n=1 Tax=Porphyrobacter sp. YT40 TaxID=2547601 RepID=UPI0011417E1E|nr:SPOR domain-containing protein [Porphyrobacter sp. YT40]QDH35643.1 SPOR domain-containing protein [Porphyrobacter sp. YT40]
MIDAEYEELDEGMDGGNDGFGDELDLADTDNLPWLESDEDDEDAGGFDMMQIAGFFTLMVALLAVVVGGVWWVSNRAVSSDVVADGSVIPAPEGPVKTRPEDPGGKTFAGTGNVAPVVGEGGSRPAVVADTNLPPLPGGTPGSKPAPATPPSAGATKPVPVAPAAEPAPAAGTSVQLAAYGTRARAEQGWVDAQRRTEKLNGVKHRVVEGKVDIGTVYRLQAVTGSRAEADRLCAALKTDGLDCQVK